MTCGICVLSELFIFRVYHGNVGEGQGGVGGYSSWTSRSQMLYCVNIK